MERVLVRQNQQWKGTGFDNLCNRKIMQNLLSKKQLRHVQVLTGVRRCGKSTIFKLLINDLLASGVDGRAILLLNLDDPTFIPLWDNCSQLFSVVENAERITGVKVRYLFLDEVQHLQDWEVFVKSAYDSEVFDKIYVTGSNSKLLQNRFSALLSGRYFENELRPFSLSEVLEAKGFSSLLGCYERVPEVLRVVDSVMNLGSFPEIVLSEMGEEVKMELLKSYFNSIVQKDCIIQNNVRDTGLFYRFASYLLQNVGNRFSVSAVAKALKTNENTITAYLDCLCSSYLCSDMRNFSYSMKETNRSQHKCFCVDNGLVAANVFRFSPQSGSSLENIAYNELKNKGYRNISFDNEQTECDFIAYKDGDAYGFQVCYELNEQNRVRELKGFNVPNVNLRGKSIITYNQKEQIDDISVLPLWEWAVSHL